ncbi:hypothetical protein CEQ20_10310 [Yersinia pseudotuberculosis]|nr:hypothetical protein CEQ20_10310 [Yersinia pseudotuberculosis]
MGLASPLQAAFISAPGRFVTSVTDWCKRESLTLWASINAVPIGCRSICCSLAAFPQLELFKV